VAVGDWFHPALPEHSVSESGVFFLLFFFFPCFLSPLLSALSLLRVSVALSFLPSFPAAAALFGALKLQECSSRMCVIITVRRSLQKNPLPVVESCFGCCFPFF
jgi:hypothetical protein